MELRIFTEPQQGASYTDLLRVARAAQDAGFDAFFRSDHYRAMGGSSANRVRPTRGRRSSTTPSSTLRPCPSPRTPSR